MDGILYFNHGTKHLVRLLVSLRTLRKHWPGPVTVLDTGESGGIVEKICRALGADLKTIPFVARRRHSCYCMKASLWRHSPYEQGASLLVDADTTFEASPSSLLQIVATRLNPGFVVTRFSDWVTTGQIMRGRIEQWQGIVARPQGGKKVVADELIRASLEMPHGAINTGVVGWRTDEGTIPTLKAWEALTHAGWRCSLTDEVAAQLILRTHRHTMLSDRYNLSCLFGKETDRVVIRHFHGNKCLRPECSRHWLPHYQDAIEENQADVCNWQPAGDPSLTAYLAGVGNAA